MTDPSETPLSDFIDQLLQEGRAITRGQLHQKEPSQADQRKTVVLLAVVNQHAVDDAPWIAPELDEQAALWAACSFAWGACMLIDRAETDVAIPKWIESSTPSASTPSDHWSVDLVFRLAEDLFHRSQKICDGDPLHNELQKLLSPWPLACVGTTIENLPANIRVVMSDDCLRTTYVDRVMLRRDSSRAAADEIQPLIQRVIGAHPELGIPSRNDS